MWLYFFVIKLLSIINLIGLTLAQLVPFSTNHTASILIELSPIFQHRIYLAQISLRSLLIETEYMQQKTYGYYPLSDIKLIDYATVVRKNQNSII